MPCFPRDVFVDAVDDEFVCSSCGGVMDVPAQLPCGHDCGVSCVSSCCPVSSCRQPILQQPVEITRMGRMVAKMQTLCRRCGWRGVSSELAQHPCPYDTVECPYKCGATTERRHLQQHQSECAFRTSECAYCFRRFRASDLPMHMNSKCAMAPVSCSLCHAEVRRGDLAAHVDQLCPKKMIMCPFAEFGCRVTVPREALEMHVTASLAEHCAILTQLVLDERRASAVEMERLQQRVRELEDEVRGKSVVDGQPIPHVLRDLVRQSNAQDENISRILGGRMVTVDAGGRCGMFASIQTALDNCQPGDAIVVRPGAYKECIEVTAKHDKVSIQGAGMDSVFLSGRIVVNGCHTFCIRNMSILNRTDRDAPCLRVTGGSIALEEVHLTSVNLSCCLVEGDGSLQLASCLISGTQQHGVHWRSEGRCVMKNCQISDCGNATVCIERGEVLLDKCDVYGGKMNGISVRPEGVCRLLNSSVHDHAHSNIDVQGTFHADEGCSIFRSERCGVFVGGTATLAHCKVFENKLANVFVVANGGAVLHNCKILSGLQHGVVVKKGGSVTLRECIVSGNCIENIVAEVGATVDV